MITVYHNHDFLMYIIDPSKIGWLTKAAIVETEDLQEAYTSTNNIDAPWSENKNTRATTFSLRSTSAGDVLEQDSKFYVVESCGFRELSNEEAAGLTFWIPEKS